VISPRRPTAKVQFEGFQVLFSIATRVGATYIVTAIASPQLFASGARGPQARVAPASTANVPRRSALVSAGYWSTAFAALSLLLLTRFVEAQQSSAADDAATDDSAAQTLTSTEQGRTTITDSFKSRRDKIKEERRTALSGTEFTWQVRTYDLERINSDDSRASAWAIGGSAGLQTGLFRDLFSFGATGYTSQPLYAPNDEGGTKLLTSDQSGYTVLGEAYAHIRLNDDLGMVVGRSGFDTPYLSRNDSRMTPQTFEGIALQGATAKDSQQGEWRYGGGYFDKEKEVDSADFINMAKVAGASVDRGVYLNGVSYKQPVGWGLGLMEYYSPDIINIAYAEVTYVIPVAEERRVNLSSQYTSEHSVGQDLLTGKSFSADQLGLKAELATGPALLTAAYTETGRGTTVKSPWSGYPGYTSVQYGDFNAAGENAFMLRAACNIRELPGVSVYGLWVRGSAPQAPATQNEYDANLQWSPRAGMKHGLIFRARFAYFTASGQNPVTEFRFMLFYTPPSK